MLGRIQFLAVVLSTGCYAIAATHSIGNVTARGETRIDNYPVKGSGTVFDGSSLETGQSASSGADVRLIGDSAITLDLNSRGTVFRDHFVLQRGRIDLSSSPAFHVETHGIVVTPSSPSTSGSVRVASADTVTVDVVIGAFEVRSSSGALIARVHAGQPLTFTSNGKPLDEVSTSGVLTSESGRYFIKTAATDINYEVKGNDLQGLAGREVSASGTLANDDMNNGPIILARSVEKFDPLTPSNQTSTLVSGLSIGDPAFQAEGLGKCGKGAKPEHCCPNDPKGPMCCPNDLNPARRCHHSK